MRDWIFKEALDILKKLTFESVLRILHTVGLLKVRLHFIL